MDLELRHFRYFIAVAQALHFTRAASQLGIAVPTLTRQIQQMEERMGVRLFARTQRSVALTDAGRVLLPEAVDVLERFESAQRQARREARGETGVVRLGYVASAVYGGVLQTQVGRFRESHPGVTVTAQEAAMVDLPTLVLAGEIDGAYLRAPVSLPDGLESRALTSEPFVLALHAQSWLARLEQPRLDQLRDECFILPEQSLGTERVAALGGFVPRLGPQPGGLVAVLALVSLGLGIAVVPRSAQTSIALPQLVFRSLPACDASSYLLLIWRRHEPSGAVRRFVEMHG